MNPKYVCMDIGNVLCNVDEEGFRECLSYKLNINTFKAKRFLKRFQQIHDLGFTTMEDELTDQFNIKSPYILKEIVQKWNDCVTPYVPMLNVLNDLRKNDNLKIALLSNIGLEHAALLQDILSLDGFFNSSIKHLSCFVGARKPSTIYFQSFLLQHPEFTGALYVDDLQANLDGAKPLGFRTHRFDLSESGPNKSQYDKVDELYRLIKNFDKE
jgi:FMN phosphatase YigB (HAD superfamily)